MDTFLNLRKVIIQHYINNWSQKKIAAAVNSIIQAFKKLKKPNLDPLAVHQQTEWFSFETKLLFKGLAYAILRLLPGNFRLILKAFLVTLVSVQSRDTSY